MLYLTLFLFQIIYALPSNVQIYPPSDTAMIYYPFWTLQISNSIFYFFHNSNNDHGGAVKVCGNNCPLVMQDVGFVNCKTMTGYNGGAIFSESKQITISNVCAWNCEAAHASYEFAYFNMNAASLANNFSHSSIYQCGPSNQGRKSLYFDGSFDQLSVKFVNSTSNFNYYDAEAAGSCICLHDGHDLNVNYYNCLNCIGRDMIFIEFGSDNDHSLITNLNVYNCSGLNIMRYIGQNIIDNGRFGQLDIQNEIFIPGRIIGNDTFSNMLTVKNCYIDISNPKLPPSNQITIEKLEYQSPIQTINMDNSLHPLDYCQLTASAVFTASTIFTMSSEFTFSSPFTTFFFSPSIHFTASQEFSQSETLIHQTPPASTIFSSYHPTDSFTPSDPFTPSFTFSPERTKYPDGLMDYQRANVSGWNLFLQPPSAEAIVTVSSLTLIITGISIFLMLLYLRNKHKQMQERELRFFEDLLDSQTENTDTYSYSFYTYEDYTTTEDEEDNQPSNDDNDQSDDNVYSTDTEDDYLSDFNGSLLDSEIYRLLSDSANSV